MRGKVDFMRVRANLGGGSINPTYISGNCLYNNATATVTIDLSKSYVLTSTLLFNTSVDRVDVYSIVKGTLTKIHAATGGYSYGVIDLNGTTLTLKGTDSTNYTGFVLTQLD